MAWKIDQKLIDAANEALERLQEEINSTFDEWDQRSEKWKEGEKGEVIGTWIEAAGDYVDNAIAELGNIETEPDA